MLFVLCVFSIVFLFLQYLFILVSVLDDKGRRHYRTFRSKKVLFLNLIPFFWVYLASKWMIKSFVESYNELPNN